MISDNVRAPLCLLSLLKCDRDSQHKAVMTRWTAVINTTHAPVYTLIIWVINCSRKIAAQWLYYSTTLSGHDIIQSPWRRTVAKCEMLLFSVWVKQLKLTKTPSTSLKISAGAQSLKPTRQHALVQGVLVLKNVGKGSHHVRIFSCKSSWKDKSDWNWNLKLNKRPCIHTDWPVWIHLSLVIKDLY